MAKFVLFVKEKIPQHMVYVGTDLGLPKKRAVNQTQNGL